MGTSPTPDISSYHKGELFISFTETLPTILYPDKSEKLIDRLAKRNFKELIE